MAGTLRHHLIAGAIHLAVSATIALVAMFVIFVLWYPGALAQMQGVSQLVLILIGVDVVLGPLITTIIYSPGKKGLRFDLAVISSVQTIALLFGLKAIYGGAPAYLVFNIDRFDVVANSEISKDRLAEAPPDLQPSLWGPVYVGARLPSDPEKRTQILMSAVSGGADLPQLPQFFVPLEEEHSYMITRLRPLKELKALNDLDDSAWAELLESLGEPEAGLGYLPVRANSLDGAMIVDRASGETVSLRALTPRFDAHAPE